MLFVVAMVFTVITIRTGNVVPTWLIVVDIGSFAWLIARMLAGAKDASPPYSNGYEYEQYVARKLAADGYKYVEVTQGSGDYGADIICYDRKGNKYAIQCKYYSKAVGYRAVEETVSGMMYYGCDVAMVITNNTYTRQAMDAADRMNVVLIDNFR